MKQFIFHKTQTHWEVYEGTATEMFLTSEAALNKARVMMAQEGTADGSTLTYSDGKWRNAEGKEKAPATYAERGVFNIREGYNKLGDKFGFPRSNVADDQIFDTEKASNNHNNNPQQHSADSNLNNKSQHNEPPKQNSYSNYSETGENVKSNNGLSPEREQFIDKLKQREPLVKLGDSKAYKTMKLY